MNIKQYVINTGMGRGRPGEWEKISFLSQEDIKILNDIGYGTNKDYTREYYLNKKYKGKYLFSIIQDKFDTGDFCESFKIAVVQIE